MYSLCVCASVCVRQDQEADSGRGEDPARRNPTRDPGDPRHTSAGDHDPPTPPRVSFHTVVHINTPKKTPCDWPGRSQNHIRSHDPTIGP